MTDRVQLKGIRVYMMSSLQQRLLISTQLHSFIYYEKVMEDFDRDYWMDAKESKKYGIVDGILDKL